MGLRYDLTLPLSRYYAANRANLPVPFKVIQTDRVFRAERPQKGRMREFVQCDIDILGDDSINAEIELIDTTARALLAIGFTDFTVNINDRRMLRRKRRHESEEDMEMDDSIFNAPPVRGPEPEDIDDMFFSNPASCLSPDEYDEYDE